MAGKELNPILGGIIKAAVAPVVTAILAYISPPVLSFLKLMWGYVLTGRNWLGAGHQLYGWLILVMSLCSFAVVALLIYLLRKRLMPTPKGPPVFKKYIQDRIFDVVCRWRWNSYNEPDDVRYFCPTCEGELGYTDQSKFVAAPRTGLGCYNCQKLLAEFDGDTDFVDERILAEIDRRARVDHGKPTH